MSTRPSFKQIYKGPVGQEYTSAWLIKRGWQPVPPDTCSYWEHERLTGNIVVPTLAAIEIQLIDEGPN